MQCTILMSTFNGYKYIREQLDSIYKQDYEGEIVVYIRDDGSTDGTLDILENYKRINKVNMIINKGVNIGTAKSYLDIIRNAPKSDFYAFCDQDDVWTIDKLTKAISKIQNYSPFIPVLWSSNFDVVDQNLNEILKAAVVEIPIDPMRVLFFNTVPGCTMVFNYSLLYEMKKLNLKNLRMHDIFALSITLFIGEFIFESRSCVLYRQHENNVIGFLHKKIILKKWIKEKILLLINKDDYDISYYAKKILCYYRDVLTDKAILELKVIANYKKSFFSTVKLLNRSYTKSKKVRSNISIRLKILLRLI